MKYVVGSILLALCIGCTDADRAQYNSIGCRHKVALYSGGKLVREWTSTGKVLTEEHSDGWYFEDAGTHRLVRVSGDVVIEPIE